MRLNRDEVTLAVQVIVTLTLLVAGIVILMGDYDQDVKKIASGWVGICLGYWSADATHSTTESARRALCSRR